MYFKFVDLELEKAFERTHHMCVILNTRISKELSNQWSDCYNSYNVECPSIYYLEYKYFYFGHFCPSTNELEAIMYLNDY